jgi:hypothetical protein
MNWQFCPHCETELDAATSICPACRWDPLTADSRVEPEQTGSLIDRYRGTEYDIQVFEEMAAASMAPARPSSGHRVRTLVMAGLIGLIGLYGAMMVYHDYEARQDRPAVLNGAHR